MTRQDIITVAWGLAVLFGVILLFSGCVVAPYDPPGYYYAQAPVYVPVPEPVWIGPGWYGGVYYYGYWGRGYWGGPGWRSRHYRGGGYHGSPHHHH
jgi:hypothetical protein